MKCSKAVTIPLCSLSFSTSPGGSSACCEALESVSQGESYRTLQGAGHCSYRILTDGLVGHEIVPYSPAVHAVRSRQSKGNQQMSSSYRRQIDSTLSNSEYSSNEIIFKTAFCFETASYIKPLVDRESALPVGKTCRPISTHMSFKNYNPLNPSI